MMPKPNSEDSGPSELPSIKQLPASNTLPLPDLSWGCDHRRFTTAPLQALVMFFLTFFIFNQALRFGLGLSAPANSGEGTKLVAKLLWGASGLALVNVLVWSLGLTWRILREYVPSWPITARRVLRYSLVGVLTTAALSAWVLDFGGNAGVSVITRIESDTGLKITRLLWMTNFLLFLTVALTTATCCALCAPWGVSSARDIAGRIRAFRLSQYLSATLLVVGLIEVAMLYNWGAVCADAAANSSKAGWLENIGTALGWKQPASPEATLARSIPLVAGIVFSTLLAVLYLPVAVVLQRRLHDFMRFEEEQVRAFKASEWLDRLGLDGQPMSVLGGFFALLTPALTGLLTHFLK
jgi:hypothetical protein